MADVSAENQAQMEKRYQLTLFLVLAQILSTFVFLALAWFLTRNQEIFVERDLMTLWLVILFLAAVTFVLRRQLFGWERLKNKTLLKGVTGLISTLQINTVVLSLFGEIVLVIGFIIAVLNASIFDMLRASAIALIVFFFNFPRLAVWKKIVASLEKV